MSRVHNWNFIIDSTGAPVSNVSIYVYLAGTNTLAYVYKSETLEDYTNNGPQVLTNDQGIYNFWIGDSTESHGYSNNQKFKIKWEHPTLASGIIDNIDVFPVIIEVDESDTDSSKNKCISNLLANGWENHRQNLSSDPHPQYMKRDGTSPASADLDMGAYKILTSSIQMRDVSGLSLITSGGSGIIISPDGLVTISSTLSIPGTLAFKGTTITSTPNELNSLSGRIFGGTNSIDPVTVGGSQTLSNKKLIYPKINSDVNLLATSTDLNQLAGVDLAEVISGQSQVLVNLQNPKINDTEICYSTSTELNQLHDINVGGVNDGDIVTNSGSQTLSNKKLILPKINSDVDCTITSEELNIFSGKIIVTTNDIQTLSNKTLTSPVISNFVNAQHVHNNSGSGGQISHSVLTNLSSNDHPQYPLISGNPTITGNWVFNTTTVGTYPTASNHYATAQYVLDKIAGSTSTTSIYYVSSTVTDQSDSSATNSLANIISTVGSSKVRIVFYGNSTYNFIANSVTVPSNIELDIHRGANLSIASGKTLTINGSFIAGPWQIFSGSGVVDGTPRLSLLFPQWFGFDPNTTSTTNTVALQSCINFAVEGSSIQILPGTYQIAGPVYINKGIEIFGTSLQKCVLQEQSASNDMFIANTGSPLIIRNLAIFGRSDVTRTANGIVLGVSGSQNVETFIDNCWIGYHGIGLNIQYAQVYKIQKCGFVSNRDIGIDISNNYNFDNGDSLIHNCVFDTEYSSNAAIKYHSGGGLKISDTKILHHNIGIYTYFENAVGTTATGDLIISSCSIEGQTQHGIYLDKTSGITFSNIQVCNCQLSGNFNTSAITLAGNMERILFTDNVFSLGSVNSYGINVASGSLVMIDGNVIQGNSLSGTIGILNSGGTNVALGKNLVYGCTTSTSGSFV